jgi:hypothetical protein
MRHTHWTSPSVRAAAVVFIVAAMFAAWALHGALRLEPLPRLATATESPLALHLTEQPGYSLQQALGAVDVDPFHPERRRPVGRFRMPGDRLIVVEAAEPSPSPPPALRLLGTVVLLDGGGVAMSQLNGEPPRLVRVGERIGDYTLRSVRQGHAVFVDRQGSPLQLHVPRPGS